MKVDLMDDTLKEQVKALFGKPQRVVLAVWIHRRDGEPFFLGEAMDAIKSLGVSASGVGAELDTFMRYGMLTQFKDGRRNYYTPVDSPLWDAYHAIGVATGLAQAGSPQQSRSESGAVAASGEHQIRRRGGPRVDVVFTDPASVASGEATPEQVQASVKRSIP